LGGNYLAAGRNSQRVAVTGMGILCALGNTFEEVLSNMQQGKTGIRQVERFPTSKFHSGIGAELVGTASEDYFTPEQKQKYDLCAQYAIMAADQALEDSGLKGRSVNGQGMGVALGTCNGGILSLEEQWTITELDEQATSRYPFYQQGDDVAAYFQLGGPVTTIHTACAASGNAIGYAYDMIRWGYAEAMLAGGSDPLSHSVYSGFNVLRALNAVPTSPFASRFGLSLGEGAAFVVMEPLERALKRGATIYAEICGYGLSNDAYHETAPDPEGRGIERAVNMALRHSGTAAVEIGYINAHGTGTQANDQAEIEGLRSVFGDKLNKIPLSSSKAYFGHTLGAAAAIEFTTSLYAIKHGMLPATLHFDEPREGCEALNIIANRMVEGRPEYILNNNSAFGGHNASIVARTGSAGIGHDRNDAAAPYSPERRVGIVGMGTVLGNEVRKGTVLTGAPLSLSNSVGENLGACTFSLKEFDPSLYERRMNRLCQFSIGAVKTALADAGWKDDLTRQDIGFIYGTARGSTDSIGKFLHSVFVNGPEFASSIHFPHTVVNSVAGKTAEKMALGGFNSSLSSGGTEGIIAAAYASGSIRTGIHERFLIAAGDERSTLSDQIDRAQRLTESKYHPLEGSVCLALADMDTALQGGLSVKAELKGCAMAYGGFPFMQQTADALTTSIHEAVARAGVTLEQIGVVLFDSPGRPGEEEAQLAVIRELFPAGSIPFKCLNEQYGYGESVSSMLLLGAAAEMVKPGVINHVLAASVSVNGNTAAAVISAVEESIR